MSYNQPDYKTIYTDILLKKFPYKMEECHQLLDKKKLSVLNILELNQKIFGLPNKEDASHSQRHRSYKETDILEILSYQKKYKLSNRQLAKHFQLSRNTVARWKKMISLL